MTCPGVLRLLLRRRVLFPVGMLIAGELAWVLVIRFEKRELFVPLMIIPLVVGAVVSILLSAMRLASVLEPRRSAAVPEPPAL